MMDGAAVNVDVTAPGAIIALALMFLKVLYFDIKQYLCNECILGLIRIIGF